MKRSHEFDPLKITWVGWVVCVLLCVFFIFWVGSVINMTIKLQTPVAQVKE